MGDAVDEAQRAARGLHEEGLQPRVLRGLGSDTQHHLLPQGLALAAREGGPGAVVDGAVVGDDFVQQRRPLAGGGIEGALPLGVRQPEPSVNYFGGGNDVSQEVRVGPGDEDPAAAKESALHKQRKRNRGAA